MPPTKSKQPVEHLDPDDIYRAKWTTAKREAYLKEHPENFAGPDGRYPIEDASDVNDAWRLAGHADNPDAVRRKIKSIAKRLGLESGLPDTAKEDKDSSERADQTDEHADTSDAQETLGELIERTMPAPDVHYYAPIIRVNQERREVIGVATVETKDAYRTVIGYEASKDAFNRWRGNIREMHDPKKAVGRALEITPDDEHKRIIVRAMISKGAEDTWHKVLDGTLTGFSIGGKNGKWTTRVIEGEELPYLERYDAVELSLVDNPACPGCNVEVVRADGVASAVLASASEMEKAAKPSQAPPTTESVERAGARISAETRAAMHMARDHAHNAHMAAAQTCGCDECQDHIDALNQIGRSDDNDGDMDANYVSPASMRRLVADIVRAEISEALRDQVAPMTARVNALLAADAQRSEDSPEITRRVDGIDEQLKAIKDLVEKIAAQPTDGGPVLHGAPVDKRLATQATSRSADDAEIMRRALELGFAPPSNPQDQVKAAARLMRPIPR